MMVRPSRPWTLACALAACLTAAACGDDSDGEPNGPASATVFAVAGDFSTTGVASTITVPGLAVTQGAVGGVASTDPVVRRAGERLYIVNRFGQDNVTVLAASDLSLVGQISTGPGSNPYDVAAVGDLLFVAALNAPAVLIVDLAQPDAGVVDSIDLSDLDEEDGIPDCSSIVALGDRIAVVCGVLDESFQPRGPGVVALLDPTARTVLGTAALSQIRPLGMAQIVGAGEPSLLVPTVADFAAPAEGGCVERVVVRDDLPVADGCFIANDELGGYASAVAWDAEGGRVWLSVTTSFDPKDFGPRGDVVSVTEEGDVEVAVPGDEIRPMDLALCPTGDLAVSDAFRGVRVFAAGGTAELTDAALDIGLPPISNGLACY